MERKLAFDIATIAAAEVRPMLHQAKACPHLAAHRRDLLQRVLNRLHRGCRLFEDKRGAEEFEELYLVLFDALACVADAIKQPRACEDCIDQALFILTAVDEKAWFDATALTQA